MEAESLEDKQHPTLLLESKNKLIAHAQLWYDASVIQTYVLFEQ